MEAKEWAEKAAKIEKTFAKYFDDLDSWESVFVDVLVDMRHFAESQGVSFSDALRFSAEEYNRERGT